MERQKEVLRSQETSLTQSCDKNISALPIKDPSKNDRLATITFVDKSFLSSGLKGFSILSI